MMFNLSTQYSTSATKRCWVTYGIGLGAGINYHLHTYIEQVYMHSCSLTPARIAEYPIYINADSIVYESFDLKNAFSAAISLPLSFHFKPFMHSFLSGMNLFLNFEPVYTSTHLPNLSRSVRLLNLEQSIGLQVKW